MQPLTIKKKKTTKNAKTVTGTNTSPLSSTVTTSKKASKSTTKSFSNNNLIEFRKKKDNTEMVASFPKPEDNKVATDSTDNKDTKKKKKKGVFETAKDTVKNKDVVPDNITNPIGSKLFMKK